MKKCKVLDVTIEVGHLVVYFFFVLRTLLQIKRAATKMYLSVANI